MYPESRGVFPQMSCGARCASLNMLIWPGVWKILRFHPVTAFISLKEIDQVATPSRSTTNGVSASGMPEVMPTMSN